MKGMLRTLTLLVAIMMTVSAFGQPDQVSSSETGETADAGQSSPDEEQPKGTVPDLREEEVPAKFQRDNLVVVPIPMSSPTFGTGLILGGAYFYPQTKEQKAAQPASFTGAAVGYTTNDSWVAGVMQQNYWAEDKWRFTGVGGYLDFKLELIAPETEEESERALDWLVRGGFVQTSLQRRIKGDWYGGVTLRYLDITQDLDLRGIDPGINFEGNIQAAGIGLDLIFDTRDLPANPWDGHYLELKAMSSHQSPSRLGSYQGYNARYRSYHKLTDRLVLAGDASACTRSGDFPLWDSCWLSLRGFPITRYMAKTAMQVQGEARLKLSKRWGVVAFAGAGDVKDSLTLEPKDSFVPSYGVGIRFMVLQSQRINVRVDYGRSNDGQDAWYLSVAEAF